MRPMSSSDGRVRLPAPLRWVGMIVATAELIYLVTWMGLDLGLIDVPADSLVQDVSVHSLAGLLAGMLWTAGLGLTGGMLTVLGVRMLDNLSGGRSLSGQAFARSLVVRNQIR